MTLDEMKAAGQRASAIEAAQKELAEAKANMDRLGKYADERKDWSVNASWHPELILWKAPQYSHSRDITVKVEIPFGVVQQQLAYAIQAARRKLISLGGVES